MEPVVVRLNPRHVFKYGTVHPARRAGDPAADGIARTSVVRAEILIGERIGLATGNRRGVVRVVRHDFPEAAQRFFGTTRNAVGHNLERRTVAIGRAVFVHAGKKDRNPPDVEIFFRVGGGQRERAMGRFERPAG